MRLAEHSPDPAVRVLSDDDLDLIDGDAAGHRHARRLNLGIARADVGVDARRLPGHNNGPPLKESVRLEDPWQTDENTSIWYRYESRLLFSAC